VASTTAERSQTAGLWSIRRHIVAVVLIGLSVFAVAALSLWLALGLPAAPSPDTRLNVIKIALSVVAGVGGVVALVVAYRKQRIGEVAEALRIPYEPTLDPWYHDEESEVRLSITSVISDHLRPGAPVGWQGHEFNFLRAVLRSADFADIQVTGGRLLFSLARFPGGWTSFDGMHVSGGEVWFGGAHFAGAKVTFDNAEFSGGRVQFDGADFTGGEVTFHGAKFTGGEVDLSGVDTDHYTSPPVFDQHPAPPPGLLLPGA
jgi:hypothetical protein